MAVAKQLVEVAGDLEDVFADGGGQFFDRSLIVDRAVECVGGVVGADLLARNAAWDVVLGWDPGAEDVGFVHATHALHEQSVERQRQRERQTACVVVFAERERAAARGLRTGMQQALDQVEQAVRNNVAVAARERQLFDKELETILNESTAGEDVSLSDALKRMLIEVPSDNGVRAITHNDTSATPVS